MNEQENKDLHTLLHKQNRERIELAYEKALKQELRNPVVLVLDLNDSIARRIAEIPELSQRVVEVVANAESRGNLVPIGLWHLPGSVAANKLWEFPDLAALVRESPQQGAFYSVVVSAGGASLILTPCP